jgi:antitoxin VapB
MALRIESEQIDRLARALAEATGESVEDAVSKAIQERLERVRPRRLSPSEQERRERAMQHILEAREIALATGFKAPTKEEIEEMLGMDY